MAVVKKKRKGRSSKTEQRKSRNQSENFRLRQTCPLLDQPSWLRAGSSKGRETKHIKRGS